MSDPLAMDHRTHTQRIGRTRQPHWNKGRHGDASHDAGGNGGGGGGRHHAHRRATRTHTSPTGVQESGFSPQRQGGVSGGGGGGGRRRGGHYRRHNNHHRRRDHERHMNSAAAAATAAAHDGVAMWNNHLPNKQLPDYHAFDVFGDRGLMLIKGDFPVGNLAHFGYVLPLPWMHPEHQHLALQQHHNYFPPADTNPMHHPHNAPRRPYSADAQPYYPKSHPLHSPITHVPRTKTPMHIGVPPVRNASVAKAPTQHVKPTSAALAIVPPPNNSASPVPASVDKHPKKSVDTHCNASVPSAKKPTGAQTTSAVSSNGHLETQNDLLVNPRCDAIESRDSKSVKGLTGEKPKAEMVIAESITHVVSKKSSGLASSNPKMSVKADEKVIVDATSTSVAPSQGHVAPSAPSVAPSPDAIKSTSASSAPQLPDKIVSATATDSAVDIDAKSGIISVLPCNQSSDGSGEVVSSQAVQPAQATATKKSPVATSITPMISSQAVQPAQATATKKSPAATSITPMVSSQAVQPAQATVTKKSPIATSITPIDSAPSFLSTASENLQSKVAPASNAGDKPLVPKKASASVLLPIPIESPNKMPTPTTTPSLKKKSWSRATDAAVWQQKALESASFTPKSSANKPSAPAASPPQSKSIATNVRSTK